MRKRILAILILGLLCAAAAPVQAEPDEPGGKGSDVSDLVPCSVVRIYTNNGVQLFVLDPVLNIVDFDPDNCYDVYVVSQIGTAYFQFG